MTTREQWDTLRADLALSPAVVAVRPVAVRLLGASAAILLAQLVYWAGKGRLGDGWVYKSARELRAETGLTTLEQATARRKLVVSGLMREVRRGIPPTMHFQLQLLAVSDLFFNTGSETFCPLPKTMRGQHEHD